MNHVQFGPIRIYFSALRIFAGVRQAIAREWITEWTFRLYTGYLSVFLPVCLFFCLPVYLSVCLSVCRPVYLPVCLPVYLSLCLPVYLSLCLPTKVTFVWLVYYEHAQYIRVDFNGDRSRARRSVIEGERAKFLLVICFLNLFVSNFSNVIKKSVFTKWSLFCVSFFCFAPTP